jgi:hypothetical protein
MALWPSRGLDKTEEGRRSSMETGRSVHSFSKLIGIGLVGVLLFSACAIREPRSAFDPKKCIENIPNRVEGLTIVSGPRTEKSIIRQMVPIICNGQVLFNRMSSEGQELEPGFVLFRVVVEYTGEVSEVKVVETTIQSKKFIQSVSVFIRDADFVFWGADHDDTVFLYPARFVQ